MTRRPLAFLALAVATVPVVAVVSAVVTTWLHERVWLPRIAGED